MPCESLVILQEPKLEFRYQQTAVDPRDGLALFGPFDADTPSKPKGIAYGAVGTAAGIQKFTAFADRIERAINTPADLDPRLWPMFPGFEAAFNCHWEKRPSKTEVVDGIMLENESRFADEHQRADAVVRRYLNGIEKLAHQDERADFIVCIVPDFVWARCRTLSRVPDAIGNRIGLREKRGFAAGQQSLFPSKLNPEVFSFSPDFRRQIKARAMTQKIPIQIIRESTLVLEPTKDDARQLTPLCDRAWNLTVAMYYKAGGKPWRLGTAREGVSYIGLAYRQVPPPAKKGTAVCAAQMFLDSGDGFVFMGRQGPWYSEEKGEFHLTRDAARDLLAGALRTYQDLGGLPLREVFLHCKSQINLEEFEGYQSACPQGVKLIAIRVRTERDTVRLFREGTRPVLRGTFWRVNDRSGNLWSSGFKPRLWTYDGSEVPAPIRIDVQFGTTDINQVAADILGLTKLNFNACRLGESEPVTIGFSDQVGEILVSNPGAKERLPNFRFYI